MQCVSPQVAPKTVDPRRTGGSARAHHFKHPAGDLQADSGGDYLGGGNIKRVLATLVLGDCIAALPSALQRLRGDIGENLSRLQVDEEVAVISKNVGVVGGALNAGSGPGPGLRQSVIAGFRERSLGDSEKNVA